MLRADRLYRARVDVTIVSRLVPDQVMRRRIFADCDAGDRDDRIAPEHTYPFGVKSWLCTAIHVIVCNATLVVRDKLEQTRSCQQVGMRCGKKCLVDRGLMCVLQQAL